MEGQSCRQNSGLPTCSLLNFIKFNGFMVIYLIGFFLLACIFLFSYGLFSSHKNFVIQPFLIIQPFLFSFSFLLFFFTYNLRIDWGHSWESYVQENKFFFLILETTALEKKNASFCLELKFWDEKPQDFSGFYYFTSGFHGCMLSASVVANSSLPYGP